MNPPLFPSGFPVILHWERRDFQAVDSNSQQIKAVEREEEIFKLLILIPSRSKL